MTDTADRHAPRVAAVRVGSLAWRKQYASRLAWADTGVVVTALLVAQLARFGTATVGAAGNAVSTDLTETPIGYFVVTVALAIGWLVALGVFRTRDRRVVGAGVEEYRRLAHATFALFGSVAIVAFLAQAQVARGYLAVALPLGLAGLVLERWAWRRWLVRRHLDGELVSTVLVVGSPAAAARMGRTFESDAASGYRVVGVCVPGASGSRGDLVRVEDHVVEVLGGEHDVIEAVRRTRATTVAVTNTEVLGADGMRELAWALQAVDVDLVVSPGVVDVAGPRLHIRPVAGLPLLHVEEPQYEGSQRATKAAFDLVVAGLALLVASPVLLVAALAVKVTSPGPVLYRAQRVGLDGSTFEMLKLRTMVVHADQLLDQVAQSNQGAGPLFKLHRDPRVTRVGRVLRKLSIDELPQLWNVLRRDMSMVGPRPPLPSEVATYSGAVGRRLLVKPGITGLWQVSGRSDLSWDESVRLDLSYVENWSMIGDLLIVVRTVAAVLRGHGAY